MATAATIRRVPVSFFRTELPHGRRRHAVGMGGSRGVRYREVRTSEEDHACH